MSNSFFGQTVRSMRNTVGLTQRELATRLDISHTYISKIENLSKNRAPSDILLVNMADEFGVSHELFFALAGRINCEKLLKIARDNVMASKVIRRIQSQTITDNQYERILKVFDDE